MSHLIYLVRHGVAEEATIETGDAERALTQEGRRKMKDVARGLQVLGVAPEALLTSPLRRARETAEVLHAVLGGSKPRILEALENGHPAEAVAGGLPAKASMIVLVGHQPSLGELASYLLTGSPGLVPLPFRKGGAAAISVAGLPLRIPGTLEWLLTPKQLRALGTAS